MMKEKPLLAILLASLIILPSGMLTAKAYRPTPIPCSDARIVKLVLNPSDDTFVIDSMFTNVGSYPVMLVGGNLFHSLVKFDLHKLWYLKKYIDIGKAKVLSAELKLYYCGWCYKNPAGRILNTYKIVSDWNEEIGRHVPTAVRESTDSIKVPYKTDVWVTFDVTKDVKDYLNGKCIFFGWMIKDDVPYEDETPTALFRTKEYGKEFAPKLVIVAQIIIEQKHPKDIFFDMK